MDARNYFDALDTLNFNGFGTNKSFDYPNKRLPPFHRNNFGGSVGGPILRGKLFIEDVYEGLRQNWGQTITTNTLPGNCFDQTGCGLYLSPDYEDQPVELRRIEPGDDRSQSGSACCTDDAKYHRRLCWVLPVSQREHYACRHQAAGRHLQLHLSLHPAAERGLRSDAGGLHFVRFRFRLWAVYPG